MLWTWEGRVANEHNILVLLERWSVLVEEVYALEQIRCFLTPVWRPPTKFPRCWDLPGKPEPRSPEPLPRYPKHSDRQQNERQYTGDTPKNIQLKNSRLSSSGLTEILWRRGEKIILSNWPPTSWTLLPLAKASPLEDSGQPLSAAAPLETP